jgi:branched-subunit amino acid transport protein AzlD
MQEKVVCNIKGIQLPCCNIFLVTFWIGDLVFIIAENTIQRLLSRRFRGNLQTIIKMLGLHIGDATLLFLVIIYVHFSLDDSPFF